MTDRTIENENAREEVKEIIEKCVKCGLCKGNCPVFRIIREETISPRGKAILLKEKSYNKLIFDCSLCRACEISCPLGLKLTNSFRKARTVLAEEGKETKENKEMIENVRKDGNPFGKEIKKIGKMYCC